MRSSGIERLEREPCRNSAELVPAYEYYEYARVLEFGGVLFVRPGPARLAVGPLPLGRHYLILGGNGIVGLWDGNARRHGPPRGEAVTGDVRFSSPDRLIG